MAKRISCLSLLGAVLFLFAAGCAHVSPVYIFGSDYRQAVILYEKGLIMEAKKKARAVQKTSPDYKPAVELIKEVDRLAPEISREHMELGEDYEKAGIVTKAIEEYALALKYNPSNHWVERKIKILSELKDQRKPGKVEKTFLKIKKSMESNKAEGARDPEEAAGEHYIRGKFYLVTGNYWRAIDAFTAALKSVPDYKDAEGLLKRAIREKKWFTEYHFKRGLEFFKKEELDLAIREWNTVLSLDPSNTEAADYRKRAEAIREKVEKIKERQTDGKNGSK
ncbi:MAG: tetratricopeptide repeat protein [Thermodesulfobacteriota bacterium]